MPELLPPRERRRRRPPVDGSRPPQPTASLDRLRLAIITTFALAGFTIASWAVRIPDISTQVGADHGALGTVLLCLSLGALATMRLTAGLVERVGAGRTTAATLVLVVLAIGLPGLASSVPALAVALGVFGAATGALNVAMNSAGVTLEGALGRSVLPSLHASFSFGGLGGSLVGGLAAGVLAPAPHLLGVTLAGLLAAGGVTGTLIGHHLLAPRPVAPPALAADPLPAPSPPPARAVRGTLVALGVIAGCTAFAEGALGDWATLHLSEDLQAPALLAAVGYAGFSLAMACGRLMGHRLLTAWGSTRLLVAGPVLAAVGMLAAALTRDVGVALVGLVVVGLGLANVFPIAIARAGALAGSRGVSLASTVGYSGLLGGPALIGFLASRTGLPVALTSVSCLAVVAAVVAARLPQDPAGTRIPLVLPWSPAEVAARLRTAAAPVRTAARGHADALALLVPASGRGGSATAPTDAAMLFDVDTMLGRRR